MQIRVGILTCSDKGSVGKRIDTSGHLIRRIIEKKLNGKVVKYKIVPDEKKVIATFLKQWTDKDKLDLILTTGGTGLAKRDVTPEATKEVVDYEIPGFGEIMRIEGYKKTPFALLSRAIAGVRKKSLIINLPGSERAVKENLSFILPVLPHALEIIAGKTEHKCSTPQPPLPQGPFSVVELLRRMKERNKVRGKEK